MTHSFMQNSPFPPRHWRHGDGKERFWLHVTLVRLQQRVQVDRKKTLPFAHGVERLPTKKFSFEVCETFWNGSPLASRRPGVVTRIVYG